MAPKNLEPLEISARNQIRGVGPECLGVGLLRFIQIAQRDVRAAKAIERIGIFLKPIDDLEIQGDRFFPISFEGSPPRLLAKLTAG